MPSVTIDGTPFYDVTRRIAKRAPIAIDGTFLPVVEGFGAEIDGSRNQLILVAEGGVILVQDDHTREIPWDKIQEWTGEDLATADRRIIIRFGWPETRHRFSVCLHTNIPDKDAPIFGQKATGNETSDWITTLPDVPGYRTVRSFGLVTAVDASSVWTAGEKGRTAMSKVLSNLWLAAEDAGANAIVGLQSSAFGAGGGITSVVGGDAVGVLLVGTAVEVVRNEVADDGAGDQDPDNDPEE